jgi:hypothetical protein
VQRGWCGDTFELLQRARFNTLSLDANSRLSCTMMKPSCSRQLFCLVLAHATVGACVLPPSRSASACWLVAKC